MSTASRRPKNLLNWSLDEDNDGQFAIGVINDGKEVKEWETSHLTKVIMHRAYAEACTDSGSIYILEYKNAKPGGHVLHISH